MDQSSDTYICPAVVDTDDAALVGAARDGDASCFEALISRYQGRLFRLAKNITQNSSDAQDAIQETLLKAFEHLGDFKGDSRFYTWLVRITINEALMELRKRRPNHFSLDDPIETGEDSLPREVKDWGPTPEEKCSQNELAEILSGAIGELHPALRIVFQLCDVENVSTEETANLLGVSIPAVKSRLLRARLKLREKLAPHFRKNLQCSTIKVGGFAETRHGRQRTMEGRRKPAGKCFVGIAPWNTSPASPSATLPGVGSSAFDETR